MKSRGTLSIKATMTQISHLTPVSTRLIDGLKRIQSTGLDLALVPLNNKKQPLGDGWQNRPFTATQLIEAIHNGGVEVPIKGEIKKIQPQGFGVITGNSLTTQQGTYTLMAVDLDGASATDKMLELSRSKPLPPTVAFTSTLPGRCQYLFLVPEKFKNLIRTKKIKTGVVGDDGKPEQIELRYSNLQSVLPPSVHPDTGQYHWLEGCAIDELEIALAPDWILEQMLIDKSPLLPLSPPPRLSSTAQKNNSNKQWSDIDFAISYLNALSSFRADDYDDWLAVGMALHSVDDSLLSEWDNWSRTSNKYKPGDCEKKWKSFSRGGGVKLGTLAHMAKLDGWTFPKRKNTPLSSPVKTPSSNQSVSLTSTDKKITVTGDTSKRSDTSNPQLLSLADTVTAVTAILKLGLKDYEEQNELDLLQSYSTLSKTAYQQLVRTIRCSLDEIQLGDTDKFNQLVNWHNATLDFKKVLPPLAPAFIHDASVLNIDPISLWQYFLPTVLSLTGKRLDLDVESHRIPGICWTCVVGESGTGKTRAEGVILAPLKQRQHQEKKRWKNALAEYKQILKNKKKEDPDPEPPTPEKKYLFEVATIQAVMRRLAQQGLNGSLWARDEIAGLFKSLSQFGGSKGENEGLECLLKMWDGSGSFVDRVDAETDSYAVEDTRLSIAGGIQPGAFRQAFKDPDDPQGLQARFLYAIPQVCKPKRVKGYCQLNDILPELYDWLSNCPTGSVKLSREADNYYTHLVEFLGEKAESHPNPAIRAWMRKLSTQVLRIALGLHLVDCYFDRSKNIWVLQLDTLERAMEAGRYYSSAFEVIQEKVGNSENISSILLKIWDMSLNVPEGVTPRDIYRAIKVIGKRAVEMGRSVGAYTIELFTKLVEMGKGIIEKNGRTVRFKGIITPPQPPNNPNNPPFDPNNPNPPKDPTPPPSPNGDSSDDGDENSPTDENIRDENSPTDENIRDENSPTDENITDENSPTDENNHDENSESEENNHDENSESEENHHDENSPTDENHHVDEEVTEGTQPQTESEQELEVSPDGEVSPVTEGDFNSLSSEENINWLMELLIDLESSPSGKSSRFQSIEELITLFHEAENRLNCVWDWVHQQCPNYYNRLSLAVYKIMDYFQPNGQPKEVITTPDTGGKHLLGVANLASIQGLLLACKTISDYNSLLKKYNPQLIEKAYRVLPEKQQLIVDSLLATSVPYPVFKYKGQKTRNTDGFEIKLGMLVYLDSNNRSKAYSVKVWALNGVALGQCQPVFVTRSSLEEVKKPLPTSPSSLMDSIQLSFEEQFS
ncbi:Primase 2 (plasmid) [Gloeothece citriformis PCC 7424]|uniref:Primase 2 n=1 Tax=Gloeothece citriformis (strain PCC 7424) TaxID=65393 RepID=B7KMW6_GLOC7|nr:DUF3987 domain-containing protein [Gloeothece citriformis]ACK74138.1 Primase 2 [Gloeothece citriformis PCC 7424]